MWKHLERQAGGIGTRGPGETQLETDRRLVSRRIRHLKERLTRVERQRDVSRKELLRADIPTVAIVGYTNAAEMILTGDFYTAAQVKQMGLVNAVVPPDQVLDEANRLAARIACHSPAAVRLSKRLLRESQHARLPELLELSAAFQALAHETADHREAVASILEKREPHYTGE